MLQHKLKLSNDLKISLKDCEEIWVAVALMSDTGLRLIQENINLEAKQNLLVGIGLPTSPTVLRDLMNKNNDHIKSKIYHKADQFFHPKAYIIKSNGKLIGFIGSANCTHGGFEKNLELSVKTDDQEFCVGIIKWFEILFKLGVAITEEFLQAYSLIFQKRIERISQDQKEVSLIVPSNGKVNLDSIDFQGQFFQKEHLAAFEGTKPWNMTEEINNERINVRNKLFKLHESIYPLIKAHKLNLHEHYVYDDTVSSAVHGKFTSAELDGMWLHYGRDKKEIKKFGESETPLDFMRLQVIIHKDSIGIWNRIGKNFGSQIDRDYFKNKILNDNNYRKLFYSIINKLPDEYFIRLNQSLKFVRDFKSEQELIDYVLTDDRRYYFIIGVEFSPADKKLSEIQISQTIIENFQYLYPTYELLKYNLKI